MANDFGTVRFLGVERQIETPVLGIYICVGLPAWPSQLLLGTELPGDLAKPCMLAIFNRLLNVPIATFFFNNKTDLLPVLRSELQTRLGFTAAKSNRVMRDFVITGDFAASIRKWRKIDPDAAA